MAHIHSTDLNRLLATLPQELYDKIYSLTFTANVGTRTITKFWRPTHLLHVDRLSRKQYATSYFDCTFFYRAPPFLIEPCNRVAQWLVTIDREHAEFVRGVQMVHGGPVPASILPALRDYVEHTLRECHGCDESNPACKVARKIELIKMEEARALGLEEQS